MIGIFDSGYGGLTVLKALLEKLPEYDYIYLGDNARAPYGGKSQELIYKYTREAVDFLFSRNCSLIILACNTASAKALRRIQQEYLPAKHPGKRVLGVTIPVAEAAAERVKSGPIGVIGTKATINSQVFETEIKKLAPDAEIYSQAAPLLVPLVEENWLNKPESKMILKKYLHPLKVKQIKTLILGCTHYPFLKKEIEQIMTKRVKVLDSPAIVADKLADYLKRHPEIESKLEKNSQQKYFTTDDEAAFSRFGERVLNIGIKAKKIEIA